MEVSVTHCTHIYDIRSLRALLLNSHTFFPWFTLNDQSKSNGTPGRNPSSCHSACCLVPRAFLFIGRWFSSYA